MDDKQDESSNHLTPFEVQMSQYFPEIFKLHILGKEIDKGGGGETHIWDLVDSLIEMAANGTTGSVFINYTQGRIDNIAVKKNVIAFKKNRPGF